MPEDTQSASELAPLSARVEQYRMEAQRLVRGGVEHPRYEMTREASLARGNLKERLALVKLIQGLANAQLHEEHFLIIGAEQRARRFVAVPNVEEFDSARVSQVLDKYLAPLPSFEVFNSLRTDDDLSFVLIVLAGSQPRPILAKTEVSDSKGTTLLRKGEIWIKKDTGLRIATREDLDAMYSERIEAEAEARARARFSHFREEILAAGELQQPSARRIPTSELIYGRDETFRVYVQGLISDEAQGRFNMLVELLRDLLVEGWNRLDAYSPGSPPHLEDFKQQVLQHKKNAFLPAFGRLVEVGLMTVKYDVHSDWFQRIVDLLVEIFETSHRLERLKTFDFLGPADPVDNEDYWGHGIPALEASIGARTLATYVTKRERYNFLWPLLKTYVRRVNGSEKVRQPFLFWPVRMRVKAPKGRNVFCWQTRVQYLPQEYFGNRESFFRSACQLEFVLELNSYLGVGYAGKKALVWLEKYMPKVSFTYQPEIWNCNLGVIVPLAEKLYDALDRGSGDMLLVALTVEKTLLDQVLEQDATREQRLDFLAAYLCHLRTCQSEFSSQLLRFSPWFEWGEKLGPLVEQFQARHRDQPH